MDNNRVYGKVVDIDYENVKSFYDRRVQNANSDNLYSTVLSSGHSIELMAEQLKIDKEILFPKLKIDDKSRVLDIGCGIGRWAEEVIPLCDYYYGIDFSKSMIDIAIERSLCFEKDNYKFENCSFQNLNVDGKIFNRAIISGVLVHICDNDITESLKNMIRFLDEKSIIFVWEPCGVEQRLTLKDFPSVDLKDKHNAIYRTKTEYDNLFKILLDNGYVVTFCEYYSALGGTVTYTDTDKIYYILEK